MMVTEAVPQYKLASDLVRGDVIMMRGNKFLFTHKEPMTVMSTGTSGPLHGNTVILAIKANGKVTRRPVYRNKSFQVMS
jgi:hypothetical protein